MKTYRIYSFVALLSVSISAHAQGSFQNLDFESANLSGSLPGGVPITNALPGWQGYLGGNQTYIIIYDTLSLGAAAISVHDSASSKPPIQGSYSVILQPQFNPNNEPGRDSAAIAQSGQIPDGSLSVQFYSGSESMQATFNGQNIPLTQLGATGSYLILGGDISSFAGQTGELRFTMPSVAFSYNIPYLDNIMFSTQPVPEPSTLGLLALGALFLGWQLRREARR